MKYGQLAMGAVLWMGTLWTAVVAGAQEATEDVAQVVQLPPSDNDVQPVAETKTRALNLEAPPAVLKRVVPQYPAEAASDGLEGRVILKAMIDKKGEVAGASIVSSSGYQLLDAAALKALRLWRFSPATGKRGEPVQGFVQIPMTFQHE